jgi:hypothetical protein
MDNRWGKEIIAFFGGIILLVTLIRISFEPQMLFGGLWWLCLLGTICMLIIVVICCYENNNKCHTEDLCCRCCQSKKVWVDLENDSVLEIPLN